MPASHQLQQNDLEKILGALFDQMQQKGQLPASANKESIIQSVSQALMPLIQSNNITTYQLKDDPNLILALKTSLVAQFVNATTPGMKIAFEKLFDANMQPDELKNQFKLILSAISLKAPQLKLDAAKIDKIANALVEKIQKNKKDSFDFEPKPGFKDPTIVDIFAEMAAMLASLYGGVNVLGQAGTTPRTVQSVMGKFLAIAMIEAPESAPETFLADQTVFQPGKTDAIGAQGNMMANGALNTYGLSEAVEDAIESVIHPAPSNRMGDSTS